MDEVGLCGALASTNNERICNSFCAREMILRCIVLDDGYFDPNLCIFGWCDFALLRRGGLEVFQLVAFQKRLSSLCLLLAKFQVLVTVFCCCRNGGLFC